MFKGVSVLPLAFSLGITFFLSACSGDSIGDSIRREQAEREQQEFIKARDESANDDDRY